MRCSIYTRAYVLRAHSPRNSTLEACFFAILLQKLLSQVFQSLHAHSPPQSIVHIHNESRVKGPNGPKADLLCGPLYEEGVVSKVLVSKGFRHSNKRLQSK